MFNSPNMRSIMGFLPVVKEGPKGLPGLKVTDFQTIPIDMNIYIYIYLDIALTDQNSVVHLGRPLLEPQRSHRNVKP